MWSSSRGLTICFYLPIYRMFANSLNGAESMKFPKKAVIRIVVASVVLFSNACSAKRADPSASKSANSEFAGSCAGQLYYHWIDGRDVQACFILGVLGDDCQSSCTKVSMTFDPGTSNLRQDQCRDLLVSLAGTFDNVLIQSHPARGGNSGYTAECEYYPSNRQAGNYYQENGSRKSEDGQRICSCR